MKLRHGSVYGEGVGEQEDKIPGHGRFCAIALLFRPIKIAAGELETGILSGFAFLPGKAFFYNMRITLSSVLIFGKNERNPADDFAVKFYPLCLSLGKNDQNDQ